MQLLIVCSPGPIASSVVWFGLRTRQREISRDAATYSLTYGAIGCALSVLLVENLARVLFEVTGLGYLRVGEPGRSVTLFVPLLMFPFMEEALKLIGPARAVSRGESKTNEETAKLGYLSGAGFSSSICLIKTVILFTKGELARQFLPQLLENISYTAIHIGTTGLLSRSLSQVILEGKSISFLLRNYILMVSAHVIYQLILASGSMIGVDADVCLIVFAVFFSLALALFLRRQDSGCSQP